MQRSTKTLRTPPEISGERPISSAPWERVSTCGRYFRGSVLNRIVAPFSTWRLTPLIEVDRSREIAAGRNGHAASTCGATCLYRCSKRGAAILHSVADGSVTGKVEVASRKHRRDDALQDLRELVPAGWKCPGQVCCRAKRARAAIEETRKDERRPRAGHRALQKFAARSKCHSALPENRIGREPRRVLSVSGMSL